MLLELGSNRILGEDEAPLPAVFEERGVPVRTFMLKELTRRRLEVTAQTLVAGTLDAVKVGLKLAGFGLPAPMDYPVALRDHLRRRVWVATLDDVRGMADRQELPVFVKPRDRR